MVSRLLNLNFTSVTLGLCFATSSTELQDDRLPIVLKMHLEFKFPPVDPVPLGDEYQDLNYTGRYGKMSFTIK